MEHNQNQPLLQPFPPSTAAAAVKRSLWDGYGILLRLGILMCIGIVSIWSNREASKGFSITVVNEASDQPSGKRFDLFYVSDDGASRLLLTTSKFVEDFLYPDNSFPKKQVSSIVLRLSGRNITEPVIVESGEVNDQFVIHVSPSLLEEDDFKKAMFVAMQHGMVRLWLWGAFIDAPPELVNGIVEYVGDLAIYGAPTGVKPEFVGGDHMRCWKTGHVARFLNYCEMDKPGFIRRLNRSMRNGWRDRTVQDALGGLVRHLCDADYNSSGK